MELTINPIKKWINNIKKYCNEWEETFVEGEQKRFKQLVKMGKIPKQIGKNFTLTWDFFTYFFYIKLTLIIFELIILILLILANIPNIIIIYLSFFTLIFTLKLSYFLTEKAYNFKKRIIKIPEEYKPIFANFIVENMKLKNLEQYITYAENNRKNILKSFLKPILIIYLILTFIGSLEINLVFNFLNLLLFKGIALNFILYIKFIKRFGNSPPKAVPESINETTFLLKHLMQTGFFNSPNANKQKQLEKFEEDLKAECKKNGEKFDDEEFENYKKMLDLY